MNLGLATRNRGAEEASRFGHAEKILKRILESATYVSLLCAALIASYVLVDQKIVSNRAPSRQSPEKLISKPMPLPGPAWSAKRNTIVIAMTTVCHFCHDSLPFYKILAGMEQNEAAPFQIVATSPEPKEITSKYLIDNNLKVDAFTSAELSTIGVSGTPTIFVVDSSGTVRKVYVGQLSEARQKELVAYVKEAA